MMVRFSTKWTGSSPCVYYEILKSDVTKCNNLMQLKRCKFLSLQSLEQPCKQSLEAFLFCPQYPYLVLPGKMKNNACRMRDTSASLNLPLPLCPPQPHTLKSCFCTVWRKPTTISRCSSLTQGCRHCPTAQRSKFRCVSARRTRCTAARPTPTVSAFSFCLRHSCSPYSVSTINTTTWKQWEIEVMF